MQGVYKKLGASTYGSLATSERVLAQTITLPMHVGLRDEDVEYVMNNVAFLASKFR
jgi:dTDP-4-amino-4,6-dideoxygalactose transaminase